MLTLFLSSVFGAFSKIKRPRFLAQASIFFFARAFKIDFSEAQKKSFESLYEMFTRKIKREIPAVTDKSFFHPADAKLVSSGQVKEGQVFLVKGKVYSLKELLGQTDTQAYEGLYFYNYYLSPQDYHRVHHPVSGLYKTCYFLKGALYPVASWFVKICPAVFAKNARTVSVIESPVYGQVTLVMVGAYNVGSLEMEEGFFENQNHSVQAGDLLGVFGLGSSVVLFCATQLKTPENKVRFGSLAL